MEAKDKIMKVVCKKANKVEPKKKKNKKSEKRRQINAAKTIKVSTLEEQVLETKTAKIYEKV